ncbi:MAG: FolM Alternative dihydrofolate reductase 1 [Ignavibacteriae bacterium]|nr:MAG: FolM Alternative dihydrofolate reductase 1 [Ignavibacteriota bacterium]
MNNKKNNVVLITGASRRLGKEIATFFAQNNFNVGIHYNKSKKDAIRLSSELEKKFCVETVAFKADLRDIKQIKKLINDVYKVFGRLDVLVNNAAVYKKANLIVTNEKIWDDTIDTNLKSTFFLSKYASEKMLINRHGVIINIASLGGLKPFKEHIPYSVSKAGLIMLTRCLAKSLAPKIRVNAIAPGTINFNEENLKAEKILLKDYVDPKEIAKLVYSLTDEFKHITGQCIPIESGNLLI